MLKEMKEKSNKDYCDICGKINIYLEKCEQKNKAIIKEMLIKI